MERDAVLALAKILGLKNSSNQVSAGGWISFSCPFGSAFHEKGGDERPSFGIKVGEESGFHCFSCQRHGPLSYLPRLLYFTFGNYPGEEEAAAFVQANDNLVVHSYEEENQKPPKLTPIPGKNIKKAGLMPLDFEYRGMRLPAIREWGLMFDPKEKRVLFPIKDREGRILSLRGRTMKEIKLRYRVYPELAKGGRENFIDPKKAGIWFGMQFPFKRNKGLFLVESEIDAVHLRQYGIHNAWASMGASLCHFQIQAVQNQRNPIVLYFDNDKAGDRARDLIYQNCKGLFPIYRISNYWDAKDFSRAVKFGVADRVLKSISIYNNA